MLQPRLSNRRTLAITVISALTCISLCFAVYQNRSAVLVVLLNLGTSSRSRDDGELAVLTRTHRSNPADTSPSASLQTPQRTSQQERNHTDVDCSYIPYVDRSFLSASSASSTL